MNKLCATLGIINRKLKSHTGKGCKHSTYVVPKSIPLNCSSHSFHSRTTNKSIVLSSDRFIKVENLRKRGSHVCIEITDPLITFIQYFIYPASYCFSFANILLQIHNIY